MAPVCGGHLEHLTATVFLVPEGQTGSPVGIGIKRTDFIYSQRTLGSNPDPHCLVYKTEC